MRLNAHSPARCGSGGLLDLTGADTGHADPQAARGAIHQRTNALQVHVPTALGDVVRVADPVAKLRSAAADITYLCHRTEISLVCTKLNCSNAGCVEATAAADVGSG